MEGNTMPRDAHNEGLIQSVVRSHAWMKSLQDGKYETIEQLAQANGLHPKWFARTFASRFFRRR